MERCASVEGGWRSLEGLRVGIAEVIIENGRMFGGPERHLRTVLLLERLHM